MRLRKHAAQLGFQLLPIGSDLGEDHLCGDGTHSRDIGKINAGDARIAWQMNSKSTSMLRSRGRQERANNDDVARLQNVNRRCRRVGETKSHLTQVLPAILRWTRAMHIPKHLRKVLLRFESTFQSHIQYSCFSRQISEGT
jgi:hypothetical protein